MSRLSRDLQKIPILRILIPFIVGLLVAGNYHPDLPEWSLLVILALFLVLIVTCFHSGDMLYKVFTVLFFFSAGYCTNILARKPVPEFNKAEGALITARIISSPVVKGEHLIFELESISIVRENVYSELKTVLMGYCEPDTGMNRLIAGRLYHFIGKLYPIRNSGNPGEYDYAGQMARNGCYYRFYIDFFEMSDYHAGRKPDLRGTALNIKSRIINGWEGPQDDLGTLKAIVLGDRSDLSRDTRDNYARSGAMHILAVSGLHVGLIWMVLQNLMFFLTLIPGGKWVRSLLIISILWFYAFMSGLSPSVCRSVTMFSLFTISSIIDRKGDSMNILMLTAFILLNIDPASIRDVGFQLSYMAVAGIIMFHPLLAGKIRSRYKIIRRIIDLTMVSISAQVVTAPTAIFYFHQFPLYFLLTNLLAVPLLSIIVSLFIIVSPFLLLDIFEQVFLRMLLQLTHLMNAMMDTVSGLPGSTIQGLDYDRTVMALSMILLLFIYLFMRYHRTIFLIQCMAILAIMVLDISLAGIRKFNNRQVIIGNFRDGSLITFFQGNESNHFISAKDSISYSYMVSYIKYAWQDKGFNTKIHVFDDLSRHGNGIIRLGRLDENAWLTGDEDIKVLFVKDNIQSGLVEFCKTYPVNMVVLGSFVKPGTISELLALSDIPIILDGSNRIPVKLMDKLVSELLIISEIDGTYQTTY